MKKIFFATIPLLPEGQLKELSYRKEDSDIFYPTRSYFPSIPMIEGAIGPDDEAKIIAVMADDKTGRSKANLEIFRSELEKLNSKYHWNLKVDDVIVLPHKEDKKKQISLFRDICAKYEENSAVYMDVTYGTKITSIGVFSSLIYAERVKKCWIKGIVYGKYPHDGSDIGELYDMRCLYEMNMLIHTLDHENADDILDLIFNS